MREITKTFVIFVGLTLPTLVLDANANPLVNESVKSEYKMQHAKRAHGKKHMMHKMARFLDLSEEQKTKIKDIYQQAKEDKAAFKESRQAYKTQLQQLMSATEFDQSAFEALRQTYAATFNEASLARAKTKHAIFQVLTDEQQEKLVNARGKRRGLLH